MGSGAFTMEAWVYNVGGFSIDAILECRSDYTSAGGYAFLITSSGYLNVYTNSAFVGQSSTALVSETWYHVALVRTGTGSNQTTYYINGVASGTITLSGNFTDASTVATTIGGTPGGENFSGYISNLRIVKGTAVYTSGFTPSTTPLTAITNTSLLICRSNRFIDNSTNNFTITRNGDVSVQRFSPFSPTQAYSADTIGGSAYFDGTGDYLSIANNAALNLGNNSWTCELWIYPTGNYTTYNTLFAKRNSASLCAYEGYLSPTNGYLGYYNGTLYTSTTAPNTGKWNHIAYVFDGTNIKIYLNGTQVLSSATSNADQAVDLYIGMYNSSGTPNDYYFGYISNFRLVKGVAVYTGTFTPPTAPLTAITNTSLLLNMTNAGIIDNTMLNNLEIVGDAKISTAVSKFGGSSMSFDGTGDNLNLRNNTVFAFNTGDFTIEAWVYPTAAHTGTGMVIFDQRGTYNTSNGINMWLRGSTNILTFSTNGNQEYAGSLTAPVNTWTHVAVVKTSGVIKSYVNGVLSTTFSYATSLSDTSACIGRSTDTNASYYFEGYIDSLRITKGYARYTANFAPPTVAFPTY
jgi:hypothetical protein